MMTTEFTNELTLENLIKLLEDFDMQDQTSADLLELNEYSDTLSYYRDIAEHFNLSFWIWEMLLSSDDSDTYIYYRDWNTIHILEEWLPEWNTIEELFKWLQLMESKIILVRNE